MKYLENLALEDLTKAINNREIGGLILNGRVELYSTKKVGDDKKFSRVLESKLIEDVNAKGKESDPQQEPAENPNQKKSTVKVLVDLIQTMNASLVDYDFSELSYDSFALVVISDSAKDINTHFAEITLRSPNFLNIFWKEIDAAMNGTLQQCEVYTLTTKSTYFMEDDETGAAWSINYFFCSKEFKRICYVTCVATSKYRRNQAVLGYIDAESSDDEAVESMDVEDADKSGEESDEEDEY